MEENVIKGKALRKAKGEKTVREFRSAGLRQAAKPVLMTAGAIVGAVLFVWAMGSPLCAESYASKPIRFIVPMAPGGPFDILARIIGQKLSEQIGQPVVIENRGGAGGNIGIEMTAKARPDGYTIVLASQGITISPSLYRKLNYDPVKDLTPISLVAQIPMVVVVRLSLPVKNLKELINYAKANPGKLNYGSGGIGAPNHLAPELLNSLAKIRSVHVPYKGVAPALAGLLGGEVDMMVTGLTGPLPLIQAGKLRAVALLSNERLPSLPNVPTAKEAGVDNYEVSNWFGILAPVGTPRDIVNRLNREWIKIAATPDIKEKLRSAAFEPLSGTPVQFSEFLKAEIARWARVVKEANIASID